MYILALGMWFLKLIMIFCFFIDKIVFNFISTIYDLLMLIARTSVLTQGDIAQFADRVYKLLAVFMVFKVTFSLIMYVVNPDDFTDKNKGISKLGTNIAISLSLLILVPYAFNLAYDIQTKILESNVIMKVIMGDNTDGDDFYNTAGDQIAFTTISAFFTPDLSVRELVSCSELTVDGKLNPDCESGLRTLASSSDDFEEKHIDTYKGGIENSNMSLMFRQELAVATYTDSNTGEQKFVMDYKPIFSTVVGIVIVLILISFCMDIAVRSLKLAFLQLIAPVPIVSYVDPKSGKDGLFKKWYDMCFKTFISLFVRLFALYFAVWVISKVADLKLVDVITGVYITNNFVKIFIIIGALMFAKQFPKMLEGLGFKMDGGGFTLNPLKKMEKDMLGGGALKPINSALGKAAKAVGTFPLKAGAGALTAAGVTTASLVTGQGFRGGWKAFTGTLKGEKFGKNFTNSYKAAHARKQEVAQMKADGVNPWDVKKENFINKFRGTNPKVELDALNNSIKSVQDGYSDFYKGVIGADKVAKAFEQRRIAAENAGDATKARLLQDAIDARVADIKSNGYNISLSGNAGNLDRFAEDVSNGSASYSDLSSRAGLGLSSDHDKGLASIDKKIGDTVKFIDKHYDGKFDYSRGDLGKVGDDGTVDNLKLTNGKSKSASRAVANSDDARYAADVYKYVNNKK